MRRSTFWFTAQDSKSFVNIVALDEGEAWKLLLAHVNEHFINSPDAPYAMEQVKRKFSLKRKEGHVSTSVVVSLFDGGELTFH